MSTQRRTAVKRPAGAIIPADPYVLLARAVIARALDDLAGKGRKQWLHRTGCTPGNGDYEDAIEFFLAAEELEDTWLEFWLDTGNLVHRIVREEAALRVTQVNRSIAEERRSA